MITQLTYWIFLALAVPAYWWAPIAWRAALMTSASVGLLGSLWPATTLGFVAGCGVMSVALAWAERAGPRIRKNTGGCGILLIAAALFACKFLPMVTGPGRYDAFVARGLLPVGISYVAFKWIHLCIEFGRGHLGAPGFLALAQYTLFPPMFTAGPIERWHRFETHRDTSWNQGLLAEGGTRIIHGFIKKFCLSEGILLYLQEGSQLSLARTNPDAATWAVTWAYAAVAYLRIYTDFSACADFAVGAGRLFGWRLMENFDWPILARNPSDFWRRWHISLSSWCQQYIYLPTIGWARNPYLPAVLSFTVMGLWHVCSWNRLGWALYQALGILAFSTWSRWRGRPTPGSFRASTAWSVASIVLTQAYMTGGMTFVMHGEDQPLVTSLRYLARLFLHL